MAAIPNAVVLRVGSSGRGGIILVSMIRRFLLIAKGMDQSARIRRIDCSEGRGKGNHGNSRKLRISQHFLSFFSPSIHGCCHQPSIDGASCMGRRFPYKLRTKRRLHSPFQWHFHVNRYVSSAADVDNSSYDTIE